MLLVSACIMWVSSLDLKKAAKNRLPTICWFVNFYSSECPDLLFTSYRHPSVSHRKSERVATPNTNFDFCSRIILYLLWLFVFWQINNYPLEFREMEYFWKCGGELWHVVIRMVFEKKSRVSWSLLLPVWQLRINYSS